MKEKDYISSPLAPYLIPWPQPLEFLRSLGLSGLLILGFLVFSPLLTFSLPYQRFLPLHLRPLRLSSGVLAVHDISPGGHSVPSTSSYPLVAIICFLYPMQFICPFPIKCLPLPLPIRLYPPFLPSFIVSIIPASICRP